MIVSKYLTPNQVKGFLKVSDVLAPGYKEMPKFSKTDFGHYIDDVLEETSKQDREDLGLLFSIFRFLPKLLVSFIITLSEKDEMGPMFWQTNMRKINIGLKGIIFALYYSRLPDSNQMGSKIFDSIGWDTKIPGFDPLKYQIREEADSLNYLNEESLNQEDVANDIKSLYQRSKIASKEITSLSVKQRLSYISGLKHEILNNQDEYIAIINKATGKTKTDIISSEIFATVDFLHYLEDFAVKALKDKKVPTPIALMGKKSKIIYDSLGTILVISPWNYPFFQAIVPIVSSFVCGNSTIYKPSEFTPLTGVVEALLKKIDFPSNWVQVVYGDGKVGSALIEGRPEKIFFTGSVKTGKAIMKQASEYLIPVELELGGKDPMIVFDDISIHRATSGALWGGLTASGQSCTSVERIYVQESIYPQFRNSLIEKAKKIKVGSGDDATLEIGPMVTKDQVRIIAEQVKDALSKGARLLTGADWDFISENIPPLVLENITEDMKIYHEESFGPVLPLISFENEREAIYLANDSQYGLSASVWSKDLKRAHRVAKELKVGGVSINNVMLTEGNPHLPFGGVKNSGIGRYKGEQGFLAFSNTKSIIANSDSSNVEAHWYPFTEKKFTLFSKMMVGLFGGGLWNFSKFLLNGLKLEGHANKVSRNHSA